MTDIIMKNGGTIDKYMGDCIMAFWNAPLDVEEQRQLALRSSHEMLYHLKVLNVELAKEEALPINVGIGLNTNKDPKDKFFLSISLKDIIKKNINNEILLKKIKKKYEKFLDKIDKYSYLELKEMYK